MFKNKTKKKIVLYNVRVRVCVQGRRKKKTVSNFYFKLRRKARDQFTPGLNISFFLFSS
jgi:hypothetical protein